MKTKRCCFFIYTILLILCCGCGKQQLPIPRYPLDTAVIEAALEVAELSWTVEEQKSWREEEAVHGLYDEKGRLIASISSIGEGGKRNLLIGFIPPGNDQYGFTISAPEEKCEKIIEFGTVLCGGFTNKKQVYDDFKTNYDSDAYKTIRRAGTPREGVTNSYEEITEWINDIGGMQYMVKMGQPDMNVSQRYLIFIVFSNSGGYPFTIDDAEGQEQD